MTYKSYKTLVTDAAAQGYIQVKVQYETGEGPKKTVCEACEAQVMSVPEYLRKSIWINTEIALVFHKTHEDTGKYELVYACRCGWRKRVNTKK